MVVTTRNPASRLATGWLLAAAALNGAAVMAVELLGARMLSVGYGGSLTVWAAMISVTLLSLAIGYFAGGWLADRLPRPAILYAILLAAAGLLVACPYARFVLRACYEALGIQWGALASSAIIFLVPLGLMGTVSPFVIRLLAGAGRGLGVTAGGVYAISTVGSVAGTLLAGLWLIPRFGTGVGFRITAVAIAATAFVGLITAAGWRSAAAIPLVAAAGLLPGPAGRAGLRYTAPDGEPVEVRVVRESPYGHLAVVWKGNYRLLIAGGIVQTGMPKDLEDLENCRLLAEAHYFQELLPFMTGDPRKASVLIIGLAGGMTATLLDRVYGMDVDCVDLDPVMIDLAREHFSFRGKAVSADGRVWLETCRKRYDFCVIDTYSGDVFPFHLASVEAFRAAKRCLKDGGVLAINFIGVPSGQAFACLYQTLRAVFGHLRALRAEHSDDVQTLTVFASDSAIEFNGGWLDRRPSPVGPDPVGADIERLTVEPAHPGGFILTDDYNPIDFIRAGEALRWRRRTVENVGEQAIF